MITKFTFEEQSLIEAYGNNERQPLIDEIQKSLQWIEDDAMWELAGNVISKLRLMNGDEFANSLM